MIHSYITTLDLHPSISILVAILIAFLGWIISVTIASRNNYRLRRNLLEAIKLELAFNHGWLNDLIPWGEDAIRYYNPTWANFRLRDDAITYSITDGQSILLSDRNLIKSLIYVSHAVRFVNQQIEEQMMVRFSSPEFSSRISALIINNNRLLLDWFGNRQTIPEEFRDYMNELHLRNSAINDFGLLGQLKPALEQSIPVIQEITDEMDRNNKRWHFWKA